MSDEIQAKLQAWIDGLPPQQSAAFSVLLQGTTFDELCTIVAEQALWQRGDEFKAEIERLLDEKYQDDLDKLWKCLNETKGLWAERCLVYDDIEPFEKAVEERDLETVWKLMSARIEKQKVPHGTPGVRDPDFPCDVFRPGGAGGECETDGHYLCEECAERVRFVCEVCGTEHKSRGAMENCEDSHQEDEMATEEDG